MGEAELQRVFLAVAAAELAALAVVLAWRAVNRGRVGPVLHRVRRRGRARAVLVLIAALAAAAILALEPATRTPPAALALVLAPLLLAASPGFQDSAWGERGVQRGWYARALPDVEAWRLIGEHVRWRLRGEWLATDVPPERHAALRARLLELAPGREALHGDAGFDPQRATGAKASSAAKSNS